MKNKKKILIIGGTGFIGFHLAKRLVKKKFDITSFSTKLPKKSRRVKNVKYVICDISKKKILKKTLKKNINYDYVVNLGGYVNHSNKIKTFNTHYVGCKNLIDVFSTKKIKRFLQLGSSVEYGEVKSPHYEASIIKEKNLKSTYGKAKLKATKLLIESNRKYNFPSVILRLYLAYGPNQDVNRFLPIIITESLKKKSFNCSSGRQLRDFIYIDDLIDLIEKFLNQKKHYNGQIFNIGTGKPKKIKNIINLIIKKLKGGEPKFGAIKLREDEVINFYPNINKVKKFTKWQPKTSFTKGLTKTINYYKSIYER